MDLTEGSETSAKLNLTPGKYPKENIQSDTFPPLPLLGGDSPSCPLQDKGKGKFHPRTGYEGPQGEYMYSSTLPSTSAIDGGGGLL
jgi:hypothetical protein